MVDRLLCALGRFDEALDSFARALAQKPDDAEAYYNRGRVFIDLNRNADALADFQKVLALKPDHAEARFAACFAELPILYADEPEIGRRSNAEAYCLERRSFLIVDIPSTVDTVQDMKDFLETNANLRTRHAAIYFPRTRSSGAAFS